MVKVSHALNHSATEVAVELYLSLQMLIRSVIAAVTLTHQQYLYRILQALLHVNDSRNSKYVLIFNQGVLLMNGDLFIVD